MGQHKGKRTDRTGEGGTDHRGMWVTGKEQDERRGQARGDRMGDEGNGQPMRWR